MSAAPFPRFLAGIVAAYSVARRSLLELVAKTRNSTNNAVLPAAKVDMGSAEV